jgi:hypothetical protein
VWGLGKYRAATPVKAGRVAEPGPFPDPSWRLRLLKSPWTEEDNERLKRLAAEGASAFRVAAALKRKVSVVRRHAKLIGLTLPSVRETRKKLTGSRNHQRRAGLGSSGNPACDPHSEHHREQRNKGNTPGKTRTGAGYA